MFKKSIIFVIVMFFITGCASFQKVEDGRQTSANNDNSVSYAFIKSDAQIRFDKAESDFKKASGNYDNAATNLNNVLEKSNSKPDKDARRAFIKERRAYVEKLKTELDLKIAKLEKKAKNAGYFILGSKSSGILAGIASGILVTASAANAPYVAGLSALSSGLIAIEGTVSEIGYVAESQIEELKGAARKAYTECFKDVNFDYLYAAAETLSDEDWVKGVKSLGDSIVEFEGIVAYPKLEMRFAKEPKESSSDNKKEGKSQ